MTLEEIHIEKVPSVPQVLVELLNLCHKPVPEFEDIAGVIEQDPAISAKILQIVNTPFYRPWSEITHIKRLLVVLGIDTVKQIAITSAVHQFFSNFSSKNDTFLTSIWIHSLLCAHVSKDLARLTGYNSEDEAYTAGLLHRIGQLVLLQNFPDQYPDILFMDESDSVIEQSERAIFKVSYCDVGAALIRSWPIHPFVADAVLYQNLPQSSLADASSLVKLLNLANRLAQSVVRSPSDKMVIDDALFGLNAALLTEVIANGRRAVIEGARTFGINANPYLDYGKLDSLSAGNDAPQLARQQLATYAHHAALVGSTQNREPSAPSLEEALKRIRRDLAVVFGLQEAGFLLCDEGGERLIGVVDDTRRRRLSDLSIILRDSSSLAAKALREKQLQCTLQPAEDTPTSILDQQLRNLFSSEGVMFLPLLADNRPSGVVVVGVSRRIWQDLIPKLDLLNLFSQQLSRHLNQSMHRIDAHRQQLDEQRELLRFEARKIIHEVNNPLSIVKNYLHILALKLGSDNPAKEEITIIQDEITRVGDILARMKDIDSPKPSEEGALQLNRTIKDLFKLFESTLFQSRKIKAHLDLDDSIPPLSFGTGAVKQVVLNLVKNAAEAMAEGGNLHVLTRDRVHKNGRLYVELQVSDEGPGMPDRVLASLFQPVASTKKNHSGLGLAIVKNLVDQMSGEISCASSTDSGTRFQILLPRTVEEDDSPR